LWRKKSEEHAVSFPDHCVQRVIQRTLRTECNLSWYTNVTLPFLSAHLCHVSRLLSKGAVMDSLPMSELLRGKRDWHASYREMRRLGKGVSSL